MTLSKVTENSTFTPRLKRLPALRMLVFRFETQKITLRARRSEDLVEHARSKEGAYAVRSIITIQENAFEFRISSTFNHLDSSTLDFSKHPTTTYGYLKLFFYISALRPRS